MGISVGFGRGKEIRDHVLAHFAANPCAVLTAKQIFDHLDTVEHRTDLADALRQMVALGEMALGDERQPGEPGGMSGPCARAVKSYRLPDAAPALTAQEREQLEAVLAAEIDPPTADPLFAVIDQLPIVTLPDARQRAARLRHLAGRLEAAAPVLAAELYEDATILEDLAA